MLAKSKLNSFETIISQELIDLEISYEEFKINGNEREKYYKESIRMIKNNDEKDELNEKTKNIRENHENA